MDNTKKEVLDLIKTLRDGVSFVELTRKIKNSTGEKDIMVEENLYAWLGLSEPLATAVVELMDEGVIKMTQSSPLIYVIDGGMINLPIAKKKQPYKNPRWIPTVLSIAT
jgi:hypothetical protein